MNKAEELKQKLINAFVLGERISNKDFKDTLEEYTKQVSRDTTQTEHSIKTT